MRVRWLPIAFGVSVLLNIILAAGWLQQMVSEAVLSADTGSTFGYMQAEADELRALRNRFCSGATAPAATAIEEWATANGDTPYLEEGYLWLSDVAVKIGDAERVTGVCLPQTWQATSESRPPQASNEGDFEHCALQPLC